MTEARRVVEAQITEAQWRKSVCDLLDAAAWKWHYVHDSRRDKPGLPDLIAVRGVRLLFIELKTMTGKIRREQAEWLEALRATAWVEVYVWRPCDMEQIKAILGRPEPVAE